MPGDAGRAPYWLTRFVILRLLGLVYFIAFLSLAQQVLPLIGADGLLPARLFLDRVQTHFGSARAGFLQIPSWQRNPDFPLAYDASIWAYASRDIGPILLAFAPLAFPTDAGT